MSEFAQLPLFSFVFPECNHKTRGLGLVVCRVSVGSHPAVTLPRDMLCHAQDTKIKARRPRAKQFVIGGGGAHGDALTGDADGELVAAPNASNKQRSGRARHTQPQAEHPQRRSAFAHACQLLGELDGGACQQVRKHDTHMQAPLTILELRSTL